MLHNSDAGSALLGGIWGIENLSFQIATIPDVERAHANRIYPPACNAAHTHEHATVSNQRQGGTCVDLPTPSDWSRFGVVFVPRSNIPPALLSLPVSSRLFSSSLTSGASRSLGISYRGERWKKHVCIVTLIVRVSEKNSKEGAVCAKKRCVDAFLFALDC